MWYGRYGITVRKKLRTVLLRTVFLRGTKLRYGIFLEEYSTENNSVPYRSNLLLMSRLLRLKAPVKSSLLKPRVIESAHQSLKNQQLPQKKHYDKSSRSKPLSQLRPGDSVL